MLYYEYGEKEIEYLKIRDKQLGKVMQTIGYIRRKVNPDLFSSLIDSILSQQISSKAAATVSDRMTERLGEVTPENVAKIKPEDLQNCGLSMRKVIYMKEVASRVLKRELVLNELYQLQDEEICRKLVEIKGVGIWTAEMLMIFSMQRPDVLSFGDMAIQRGLRMLYGHKQITNELFAKYRRRYSPYGSIASLYLWEISSGKYKDYKDPALKLEARTSK